MIELELPWPDSKLASNRSNSLYWAERGELAKAYKDTANAIAKSYRNQHPPIVFSKTDALKLELIFYPPDKRIRDLDNFFRAMKSALDGISLCYGFNDAQFHPITLDWGPITKQGKVIVRFSW